MSIIDNIIEGAMTGLGMWIMMTVMGILTFYVLKKHITVWAADLWIKIKKEIVNKLDDLTIEGKLKTKRKKKK